ncbi:MAG: type II toxin-antitoxin system RelE/ParE family toxin [Streptosporangiaceae bacterium]
MDDDTYQQVIAALRELRGSGPALGRPLADTVKGSRHKNMKELRPGSSGRSEIRILFAFDPARQAVLLVAGDKAGRWERWYKRNVPLADDRFDEHLERMRKRRDEDG